ncbi:MAG: hypothetical protein ABSE73_14865 [Planctomycetota bacterium]
MEADEVQTKPPPARRRRWLPRLRFSLQTLVIGVLLIGSGMGLGWKWEPWHVVAIFGDLANEAINVWNPHTDEHFQNVAFAMDSSKFFDLSNPQDSWFPGVWDAATGEKLDCSDRFRGYYGISSPYGYDELRIYDLQERLVALAKVGRETLLLPGTVDQYRVISPDGNRAVTFGACIPKLWKRTRPDHWYGLAWLPEFWLTLVLGCVFIWSVWRDRKTL